MTQFWGGDRNGERCSTAAAYLHPVMNRPNLTVITNAQVIGIVFDGKCATGLRYQRDGREEAAEASREVVLCGGAFGSSQLLLLSGKADVTKLQRTVAAFSLSQSNSQTIRLATTMQSPA